MGCGRVSDGQTSRIDTGVAKELEKYDIRLILSTLERARAKAGRQAAHHDRRARYVLPGRGRAAAGDLAQRRIGATHRIEIVPGKGRTDLAPADMVRRIFREMTERFRKTHPDG